MNGDSDVDTIQRVGAALARRAKHRLLDEIAWPREVEEEFFASGASRLPAPEYSIDRGELDADARELERLEASIEGDGLVDGWLRRSVRSNLEGNRLLASIGTKAFADRAREIYGGARTCFFGTKLSNLDLANHLKERLRVHGWDEAQDEDFEPLDAPALKAYLEDRVAKRDPPMPIEIVLDERCTAKALAGTTRVRVRPDATFAPWEAEGLFHHEIETHALSAQNGGHQPVCSFLRAGGPHATKTQEGLAIFAELYTRSLATERLERLARRVELVARAEDGADFLELYRYLLEAGLSPRDAYFDAQRVCRGGLVTGGAPFTKDACYLAGLLEVFAFLSAVIRGGFRDEIETILAGRIVLDDVVVLADLRARGILERPRFLPEWLLSWKTLLPFFAFVSFAHGIDLAPVEQHYAALIRAAESATPRSRKGRP